MYLLFVCMCVCACQVPFATNIYGLIGPNGGLGFAIGKFHIVCGQCRVGLWVEDVQGGYWVKRVQELCTTPGLHNSAPCDLQGWSTRP